jgi:replication-associated recombination protein RarA
MDKESLKPAPKSISVWTDWIERVFEMKFLRLFKQKGFENICGFDGVKHIIRRVLDSNENFNLLLIGEPSSPKTLFLLGITETRKGVYFDVYNQSVDMLDKQTAKIICIDELDKMSTDFQNHLLNFLENGHIKDRSQIQNCKVFATCTDISGLSKSMESRFKRLHLAAYTEEQFLDVAVRVLPKLRERTARMIGEQVWHQGNKDVRDIINIAKLLKNIDGQEQMGYVLRS